MIEHGTCSMLIRQLTPSWPPAVIVGAGQAASLEDTVVGAKKQSEGHLVLTLRKGAGSVYGLLLSVPDIHLAKALAAITAKKGITLRQVGELDIS
jgi:hypothetical protein